VGLADLKSADLPLDIAGPEPKATAPGIFGRSHTGDTAVRKFHGRSLEDEHRRQPDGRWRARLVTVEAVSAAVAILSIATAWSGGRHSEELWVRLVTSECSAAGFLVVAVIASGDVLNAAKLIVETRREGPSGERRRRGTAVYGVERTQLI